VSKNDVTNATKSRVSVNKEKKPAGKTAKLKSSKWYQGAVRSIGINKRKPLESRGKVVE